MHMVLRRPALKLLLHLLSLLLPLLVLLPSLAQSTRLPLEVYELTPASSAADGRTSVKHKSLEYSIYDAKELAGAAATPTTTKTPITSSTTTTTTSTTTDRPATAAAAQLTVVSMSAELQDTADPTDTRRARQMLHMGQQQQQQHQQQQHRFGYHTAATKTTASDSDNSSNKKHIHSKDVRILYQVGDSENDLPICAPNAVCSKIDLYEKPWIERQCRCPESNRLPNNVILHHHTHNSHMEQPAVLSDSQKYRSFYEKEKLLQHKRLLLSEFNDKKFESLHLKKLMQKLGAVYEDDLHFQSSDYLDQEYNDALPPAATYDDYATDNEFPHATYRDFAGAAHMRHSGHRGFREPLSFIGGCPSSLGVEDGHTIADKTRHYKLCQPVHKLPVCKHFRDYTWTLTTAAELNVTEQIVHCRCPKNSVTYLTKREPAAGSNQGFRYLFACSPLTRLRCQRKQPCKLFTVRKRQEFLDEVNINSLCQCPKGHRCPSHHTQSSVIAGESFLEDNIQTYSGYCMAND